MAFTRFTKSVLNVSALPDRVQNQAQALKATFDQAGVDIQEALNSLMAELEKSTSASNIGANVGTVTTKTVQAILTAFESAIANRYTKTEAETLLATGTNNLVADIDVNLTTGVITVTKKDGTVETIDTAIEKVPAKFEIVESGDTFTLKITNVDGTTTQTDITNFMNIYNFNNSDNITFEVTGEGTEKTVTANIKANSIGLDKLSLSVVSTLEGYMNSAKDSATAAKTSETNARNSELNALEAENTAVTKAAEAAASASAAKTSETNAAESADEAEYWAKQAQDSSQGGDMQKSTYDADRDGVVDNSAKLGGQLPSYYAKATDLSDKADKNYVDTAIDNLQYKVLEASTDNVVDFNTLTDKGIYMIKNCTTDTTLNAPKYINSTFVHEIFVQVTHAYKDGELSYVYQKVSMSNHVTFFVRQTTVDDLSSWGSWDKTVAASDVSAGTLSGQVKANITAVAALDKAQVRNITASTADLTAGTSALATGDIVFVYE